MGKGESVSEWDAAEELTRYRAMGEHFAGVRFAHSGCAEETLIIREQLAYENISATGKNAGASRLRSRA